MIETDWSWMLQSACMAANDKNMSGYLKCVYSGAKQQLTPTHICAAHVLHRVALKCGKLGQCKWKKEKMVHVFRLLMTQTTLQRYDCNIEADMQGVSGRGEGVCR